MKKWTVALLAVVIVAVLGIAAFSLTGNNSQTSASNGQGTNIAFYNQANAWVHAVAVISNVTVDNQTKPDTYFADVWMKPSTGTTQISLSNMLGYGDKALPAGTTMRVKVLRDLASNDYAGQNQTSNSTIKVWSNAQTAPDNSAVLQNIQLSQLVYAMSSNVTDNSINVTSDATQGATFLQGVHCAQYEFLLTVNADGSASLTLTQPVVFCDHMATSG
jgi:hypothetical protein